MIQAPHLQLGWWRAGAWRRLIRADVAAFLPAAILMCLPSELPASYLWALWSDGLTIRPSIYGIEDICNDDMPRREVNRASAEAVAVVSKPPPLGSSRMCSPASWHRQMIRIELAFLVYSISYKYCIYLHYALYVIVRKSKINLSIISIPIYIYRSVEILIYIVHCCICCVSVYTRFTPADVVSEDVLGVVPQPPSSLNSYITYLSIIHIKTYIPDYIII